MGVVLAATHVALDQKVAIKFLLPDARAVVGLTDRFANEARASARLRNEHVARILDVDALPDGTPYMVMEYLEGKDLGAILAERGRIGVDEACDYVLQACEALAEAHARGIVHRDMKPGNLFVARTVDGGETVKVLDFGISKNLAQEGADFSLTKTSAVLGSPLYMPPEQMSQARTVDSRADIWSLGVLLYEAVTGTMPFEGTSLTGIVATVIQDPPKPMSDSRAPIPAGFEEVVLRCLEKSPAHRYATVGELAQALLPFAPRSSATSLDRISRIEAASVSGAHPARSSALPPSRSEPPPMHLVRIRRVDPPQATRTVVKPKPPPAAAATNAGQMLDARRPRNLGRTVDPPEEESKSSVVIAVLSVVAAVLLVVLFFVRPGRAPHATTEAPPVPAAPPVEPPVVEAPPTPAPPTPAPPMTDTASPAPPPTFTAAEAPPPSAMRPTKSPPVGRSSPPRTAWTPVPTALSPSPAVAPSPAPTNHPKPAAPPPPSIDMEPK
jgi:serine/threonine-protein kinase